MKLSEYIKKLSDIEAEYGGDIPVLEWVPEYDGTGCYYTSAGDPQIIYKGTYIDDFSDVLLNGWLGITAANVEKSKNNISFDRAVSLSE